MTNLEPLMLSERPKVVTLTHADINWEFSDSRREPTISVQIGEQWPERFIVDPFPCYPHDAGVADEALEDCRAACILEHEPSVWLTSFETVTRFQGLTVHRFDYRTKNDDGRNPWYQGIILWGKRVPLHPALTRYLVAHEYGHCVANELCYRRGLTPDDQTMLAEYADLRGLDKTALRGDQGGKWHLAPSEVFANDFRILIACVELEYWPHPGVERPEALPEVSRWWRHELKLGEFGP